MQSAAFSVDPLSIPLYTNLHESNAAEFSGLAAISCDFGLGMLLASVELAA
jgi:hypothetical protein